MLRRLTGWIERVLFLPVVEVGGGEVVLRMSGPDVDGLDWFGPMCWVLEMLNRTCRIAPGLFGEAKTNGRNGGGSGGLIGRCAGLSLVWARLELKISFTSSNNRLDENLEANVKLIWKKLSFELLCGLVDLQSPLSLLHWLLCTELCRILVLVC